MKTLAHDIHRAKALLRRYTDELIFAIINEEFHHYRDEMGNKRVADRIRREVLDVLEKI